MRGWASVCCNAATLLLRTTCGSATPLPLRARRATRRLRRGQARRVGIERPEGVRGELLLTERGLDEVDHQGAKKPQVVLADIGGEDRKQRSRVREQKALAPIDPQ